jgi:hypothetical protein
MRAFAHIEKGNPGRGSRRAGALNIQEFGRDFIQHLIDAPQA